MQSSEARLVDMNAKPIINPEWVGKEIGHLFHAISLSSKAIGRAKIVLGIFALALILTLILWPLTNSFDKKLKMTFANIPTGAAKTPTMVNPRFHGIDRNDKPYTVFADSALEETSSKVNLVHINGEMAMGDGWVSILSDRGEMNIDNKTVELHDTVHLFSDTGYEFFTDKAHTDMGKSTASGDDPVTVQGPLGIMHATGFTADGRANKFFFKGPVDVTIYPENKNPAAVKKPGS